MRSQSAADHVAGLLPLDETRSRPYERTGRRPNAASGNMKEMEGIFSAMAAVGPGAYELLRVQDLLDQLAAYEPDRCVELVLVDDSNGAHDWSASPRSRRVRIVPGKRNGRGDSWREIGRAHV